MSAWSELPFSDDQLPMTVRLKGVRVRAWQGIPDITVDNVDQVEILDATPWDESLDLTNHTAEVDLHDLATGASELAFPHLQSLSACERIPDSSNAVQNVAGSFAMVRAQNTVRMTATAMFAFVWSWTMGARASPF